MKIILLCAALTAVTPGLQAQNAPNREGVGETPNTVPVRPDGDPAGALDQGDRAGNPHGAAKTADEKFIHQAGKAGHMEVKLARQAGEKSSREDLKAFAAMLVMDHTAANAELAGIAKSMGVDIPGPPTGGNHGNAGNSAAESDASGRRSAESTPVAQKPESGAHALEGNSGMEFDTAFMETMEECHAKDIALFEKSGDEVKSGELKAFISKTLPVLKKHAEALSALQRTDPSQPDAKTGSPAPGNGANGGNGTPNAPGTPNR